MIILDWPLMLLMIPLPWLIWRFVPATNDTSSSLKIPFFKRIEPLFRSQSQPLTSSKQPVIVVIIWLLLLLAISRPQLIDDWQSQPVSGRELIIALDISASMNFPDLADDNKQSRLDVAKEIAGQFIERRQGDRLGLLLFASRAHWQTPLTFDHLAVKHLLSEAEIGLAGRETAVGDAIALVIKRLQDTVPAVKGNDQNKVLILMTDGANNSGQLDPIEAAEMAAKTGLKIYTLGLGADKMLAITAQGVSEINPSRDLDEGLLKNIAKITGGSYSRAKDSDQLTAFYQQIDRLEPGVNATTDFRPKTELYSWPLALALFFSVYLVVGYLLSGQSMEKQHRG